MSSSETSDVVLTDLRVQVSQKTELSIHLENRNQELAGRVEQLSRDLTRRSQEVHEQGSNDNEIDGGLGSQDTGDRHTFSYTFRRKRPSGRPNHSHVQRN